MRPEQDQVLRVLFKAYPKALRIEEIEQALPTMKPDELARTLEYSVDKGMVVTLTTTTASWFVPKETRRFRLTAESIDLLEASPPQGPQAPVQVTGTIGTSLQANVVATPATPSPNVEARGILGEMDKQIEEIRQEMKAFTERMNKEERSFQRMFLGRIVEIFGIFIALFSIVIITVNITTKVPVDTPFWQLIEYSLSMYVSPVIALLILMAAVYVIVHK